MGCCNQVRLGMLLVFEKVFPGARRRNVPPTTSLAVRYNIIGFFCVFLMLVAACSAQAANNFSAKNTAVAALAQPQQTIPLAEHLVYEVSWMGVPVGLGILEVKELTQQDGRKAFHVVAVAETNEFLSKIYPVHDEVHSWIDAETFQSLQFQKKVSEGSYRANEIIRYDGARKKGYYQSLKNGTKKEFDIAVPVHDILSAFYWSRRQSLEPGKSIKTIVNSDEKDWDLEIQVLRRETKELRGQGLFDTILIEPKTRLKGVLEKRGRVWVYLKNDRFRTPVLITFRTPFGPAIGILKKVKVVGQQQYSKAKENLSKT